MPCNALFQLGMGSARLNASQKEETFGARALAWSVEAFGGSGRGPSHRFGRTAFAAADRFRTGNHGGGNSAKALTRPAGS